LVRELSPKLLRFLAGPMQTRAYADDMLQECWLRIHRARHTYRPGSPVLPWVYAIARYTRVDAYRRRRRVDSNEVSTDYVAEMADAPRGISKPAKIDLWRLVERLPDSQKEVIVMLKVSGMSLEEVANATGSSVGSVKQKAHRAYEKLRSLLRPREDAG
jgi:RNA polymerase sigma-70 factor (ECF subfamily)